MTPLNKSCTKAWALELYLDSLNVKVDLLPPIVTANGDHHLNKEESGFL